VNQIASASALLLALLLAWAGAAKLRDRRGTARSFDALRVRVPVLLVVAAELITGAVLVVRPRAGGLLAAALLGAFTLVLLRAVRLPSQVRCGCFGSASTEPVGPATIVRNVLLLGLAGVALNAVRPVHSLPALLTVSVAAMMGFVVITLIGLRTSLGPLLGGSLVGGSLVGGDATAPVA
jgi:hypothetical protein